MGRARLVSVRRNARGSGFIVRFRDDRGRDVKERFERRDLADARAAEVRRSWREHGTAATTQLSAAELAEYWTLRARVGAAGTSLRAVVDVWESAAASRLLQWGRALVGPEVAARGAPDA